ncbi:MAG TPA: chromosome condensation regulator RCC1 [Actinomycetes bacterium]|nr:chromosome condensation regulator RCC1 [Actinomycetes bacterium]
MTVLLRRLAPLLSIVLLLGVQVAIGATPASAVSYGTATKISAGGYQACAITPSHHLKCWGDNDYGQLGIGSDLSDQLKPVTVPNLDNVMHVSVGDYNTCAILKGGKLKCWGYNDYGAVGDGTTHERHLPTQVNGLTSGVKSVSVGEYHACALLTSGKVKCWGDNSDGAVGVGTSGDVYKSPKVVDNIKQATQVSAGYYYSCATVNGHAKCWGYNGDGELGDKSVQDKYSPVQVFGLTSGVKQVIAGYYTTCALLKGGKLKCWGYNYYGEVGTGVSGNEYHRPVQVVGMTSGVSAVDTDYYFTCAAQNGHAKCWGDDQYNQLGDGATDPRDVPRQVSGLTSGVTDVDISFYTGCALLKSGAEKCWGWNGEGEVGIDSGNDQIPTPKRVHL